jgi:hypothetical protein
MRRAIEIIGSIVGLGLFLLAYASKIANFLGIFSLPSELKDALIVLSQVPTLISWGALSIGLFCAGYLIHDSGWHRPILAGIKTRAVRMDPSQMIISGLAIIIIGVLIGAAIIGIGLWQQSKPAVPSSTAQQVPPRPTTATDVVPKLLPDTDDGIIKWSRGYILSASGSSDAPIKIFGFQATGQNESDEFIEPLAGFIRSEITGRQFPILVNDNGTLVSPEGYGIPARYQFQIGAKLSEPGMSTVEFLRDFGRLTFEFRYGGHVYTKRFSPEELEAEVRRTEIDLRPKPIRGAAGVRKREIPKQ